MCWTVASWGTWRHNGRIFCWEVSPKKCYPRVAKKDELISPTEEGKKGEIISGIGMLCHLVLRKADFLPRKPTRISSKDTVQQISCWILKSETDEWLLNSCVKCKRASPCTQHPQEAAENRLPVRLTVADGNSQCMWCDALSGAGLEGGQSYWFGSTRAFWWTPRMCAQILRTSSRQAQWICRFTFKGNDYQQSLELECRDIRPGLRLQRTVEMMMPSDRTFNFPHCRLNNGCPVVQLNKGDGGCSSRKVFFIHDETNQRWFLLILSMIDHHHVFRQIVLFVMIFSNHPLAQTNPEDVDDFIRFLQITK